MKKKVVLPLWLGVSAAWFAVHCGSGFATGVQAVVYYTEYGWLGAWMPVFTFLLLGLVSYLAMEFCRIKDTHNYKAFAKEFYAPFGNIFVVIWDLIIMLGAVIITAAALAGSATLLKEIFSLNYYFSLIISTVIVIFCSCYGADFFRKISTVLSTLIIILMAVISIMSIQNGLGNLSAVASQGTSNISVLDAFMGALKYTGVQCTFIGMLSAATLGIQKRSESIKLSIFGSALNAGMLILVCLMILTQYPQANQESLPVLYVTKNLHIPFLTGAYQLMLFTAVISTAVGVLYGLVARLENIGQKKVPNIVIRRILWSILFILISSAISTFGLRAIVATGYSFLAMLKIPIALIPVLVLGPYRLHQFKVKQQQNNLMQQQP